MAAVLDEFAARHRVRVRHRLPLRSRRRRGDLDHAVFVGRRPRFVVAIETKAERPKPEHLVQVAVNAQRASRRHFRAVPQHRIVVHPNSAEQVSYDHETRAARMGLRHLPSYLQSLLEGAHPERLAP